MAKSAPGAALAAPNKVSRIAKVSRQGLLRWLSQRKLTAAITILFRLQLASRRLDRSMTMHDAERRRLACRRGINLLPQRLTRFITVFEIEHADLGISDVSCALPPWSSN
jgi:hypothetical protein